MKVVATPQSADADSSPARGAEETKGPYRIAVGQSLHPVVLSGGRSPKPKNLTPLGPGGRSFGSLTLAQDDREKTATLAQDDREKTATLAQDDKKRGRA